MKHDVRCIFASGGKCSFQGLRLQVAFCNGCVSKLVCGVDMCGTVCAFNSLGCGPHSTLLAYKCGRRVVSPGSQASILCVMRVSNAQHALANLRELRLLQQALCTVMAKEPSQRWPSESN